MGRFTSIVCRISAAQWTGEVTPDIVSLFKSAGHQDVLLKPSGQPLLIIPVWSSEISPKFASVGDWVLLRDGRLDLEVMSDLGFHQTFEPEKKTIEFSVTIPLNVVGPGGSGAGDVKFSLTGAELADQSVLFQLTRQAIGSIRNQQDLLTVAGLLCANCDCATLKSIRNSITQLLKAKG